MENNLKLVICVRSLVIQTQTQKKEEKEEDREFEFVLGEKNLQGFKESYDNYYEEYQEDEAVEIQKQGEN